MSKYDFFRPRFRTEPFRDTRSKQFFDDLVTFTEEILNAKLHFLCSESSIFSLNTGLYGLEKTQYLNTFNTVLFFTGSNKMSEKYQ